jgi:cation:H+ antiporter
VLGILLLGVVAAAATVGGVAVRGVGAGSGLLLALYPLALWIIIRSEGRAAWTPRATRASERRGLTGATVAPAPGSLGQLIGKSAAAAAVILVCGVLLARSGEAIATQTGLGTSFVGALLLPLATSLPEMSTVLAAVRLGRYEMAIADVFGTNLFNVNIIALVDALYEGAPVLGEAGRFSAFGALLAVALTALFVAGMIERGDRTVWRMGLDSLAAIALYVGGVAVLYNLR